MSVALNQICLPPLLQTLEAIDDVLVIAADHCAGSDLDAADQVQSRLAPDMFTLAEQIQAMTNHARMVVGLLADVAVPEEAPVDITIDALRARIARARGFIEGVDRAAIDAGAMRPLAVKNRIGVLNMEGAEYLMRVALPQVLFHATTGYDLVRHAGVEVGKKHFLGPVMRERLTPHAAAT